MALTSAHQRLPTGTGTHVTSLFSRHWHTLGPSAGQDRGAELMPPESYPNSDGGVLRINSPAPSPLSWDHPQSWSYCYPGLPSGTELQSPRTVSGWILVPPPPISELLPITVYPGILTQITAVHSGGTTCWNMGGGRERWRLGSTRISTYCCVCLNVMPPLGERGLI